MHKYVTRIFGNNNRAERYQGTPDSLMVWPRACPPVGAAQQRPFPNLSRSTVASCPSWKTAPPNLRRRPFSPAWRRDTRSFFASVFGQGKVDFSGLSVRPTFGTKVILGLLALPYRCLEQHRGQYPCQHRSSWVFGKGSRTPNQLHLLYPALKKDDTVGFLPLDI